MKIKKLQLDSVTTQPARASVGIIYTGGTFGMIHDAQGTLIPFNFSSIIDQLPIIKNLGLSFSVFSFDTPIDSSNIQPEHWTTIANLITENYADHDGFVILHGTDTMAYSASALSFMLEGLNKPVIFTGAQLPISDPRSDARENLITALEIASAAEQGRALVPEVAIYFDYQLLRGNRSKKVESMQFDAFDSGNYPPLAKAGVKIDYNFAALRQPGNGVTPKSFVFETRIGVLKLVPGLSQAMVKPILENPEMKALILETYGAGNAPTLPWLLQWLKGAGQRGVLMLNISQCPGGRVVQGRYETSTELDRIGIVSGADMTLEAALTKLMLLLPRYDFDTCRKLLGTDLAGELTT